MKVPFHREAEDLPHQSYTSSHSSWMALFLDILFFVNVKRKKALSTCLLGFCLPFLFWFCTIRSWLGLSPTFLASHGSSGMACSWAGFQEKPGVFGVLIAAISIAFIALSYFVWAK
jgi:hypothetical protein